MPELSTTGAWLLAAWLLAAATSFALIRDIFSPDKLLLVGLGAFFADIFVSDYPVAVSLAYLLLLGTLVAMLVMVAPALRVPPLQPLRSRWRLQGRMQQVRLTVHAFFWLLSLPALLAQLALIAQFGGLAGYINVLALRVVEFQGLGWLTSIVQTFAIINLVYFSYLATRPQRRWRDLVLWTPHLLVFVMLALLTGSRGSLLVNFVLMALIHHHAVRRIGFGTLAGIAGIALLTASVLEVAREGVAFGDEGLVTGLSETRQAEKQLSFTWARYGTIPLELVMQADVVNAHFGATYLTAFTNVVPRAIWPGKPDTGGVILTKEYTGDAWGGTSHLSTGVMPEAVINFGQAAGLVAGTVQFAAISIGVLLYYARLRRCVAAAPADLFVRVVRFAYVVWAATALIVGEFTNIIVNSLVQLIALWLIHQMLRQAGIGISPPPRSSAAPAT